VTVASRAEATVRLVLPAAGFALRGRVEGAAAARVAVQAVTERGFSPDEFAGLAWTDTAQGGAFAFAGLVARRVNVVVAAGADVVAVGPVLLPRAEPLVVRLGEGVTSRRGIVRDAATKAPVAGASIAWLAWTNREVQTGTQTTTDAAGRFEVAGLAQGRGYASAAGYATEQFWDAGGTDEIAVELSRLAAIEGRVVAAADGRPVEGAVVRATSRRAAADEAVSTVSGADGAFRLEGATPADAWVFVRGGGWVSVGLGTARGDGANPFFVAAGDRGPLVLAVEPAARVEGRVIDVGGAPVAGARVTAWTGAFGHSPKLGGHPEAVTDSEGRFTLADLVPGVSYSVRAVADGWAQVSVEHRAAGPEDRGLELRLTDSWTVNLRVVADEDGHPIAGAKVGAESRSDQRGSEYLGAPATTDADGRAVLGPGKRGDVVVFVEAADRVRCGEEGRPVEVGERGGVATAELRVPKGLSIVGRVELSADAPREARVEITVGEVLTDSCVAEFWTDPPEFRVDGLRPGPHVISASLNAADGRQWTGNARADAGAADVVVALSPVAAMPPGGHLLTVRVLGPDGEPVYAAGAWARCRIGTGFQTHSASVSRGTGTMRVPDGCDEIVVEVKRARDRQGRPLPFGTARVALPDPSAAEFVVTLKPARTIEGRVVDTSGRGVAGARVGADFVRGADAPNGLPWEVTTTWSASDGRFRLDGLGDGRFWVGAQAPDGWRDAKAVLFESGTTDATLVVQPAARVRVVVVDPDGAPVEGATVAPVGVRAGQTGADGSVTFADANPPAGSALSVQPPRSRIDVLHANVANWAPADTTVSLAPAAVVSGTVRDPRGRPLAQARVVCHADTTFAEAWTDASGAFTAGRLVPGARVQISVEFDGEDFGRVADVASGARGAAIVLDLGATLLVRVAGVHRDETESRVTALLPGGEDRSARVTPEGVAVLTRLPAATPLRLRFGPTSQQRWAAADGVQSGGDDVVLTLREGASIAGRVEVPSDDAWGQMNGRAERDGFSVEAGFGVGGFLFRGLAPGTWRLTFESRGQGGAKYEATADVETGTLDAVIRLVRKP
jgi:protocatechuate 3,4-dioxygenase beta subunit